MPIQKIGVVGAGQMGSGIAHVAAASGYSVLLADLEEPFLAKCRASIEKYLDREVTKGKRSPEDRSAALSRLMTTTELDRFRDADFVIEAVVEREPDKRELFRRLDAIVGPAAIL